jgi:starvation-inducible outer membrane lipoprotein
MQKTILFIVILSFFLSGCPHNPRPFEGENINSVDGTVAVKKAKHALLIGIENYRNVPPPQRRDQ